MSLQEFLNITAEDEALEVFEAGMAYLDSMRESQRAILHQNPRFWTWWRNYWKNISAAFIRASQHLSAEASRREGWEAWKASMSVGMPPKTVMSQIYKMQKDAHQG